MSNVRVMLYGILAFAVLVTVAYWMMPEVGFTPAGFMGPPQ